METAAVFLDFSARKLEQLMDRIAEAAGGISEEQVWVRGSDNENAIGNLLLHLSGNVRQWIVSAVGGRPDFRVRDREFSARGDVSKQELIERLRTTVEEAAAVIRGLPAERLADRVEIQKYNVTILEAIYHVVEHFSLHAGQIFFAVKLLSGKDLEFYRAVGRGQAAADPTP